MALLDKQHTESTYKFFGGLNQMHHFLLTEEIRTRQEKMVAIITKLISFQSLTSFFLFVTFDAESRTSEFTSAMSISESKLLSKT